MWIQIVFIRTYLYAWHTFCVNPYPQFLSTKKKILPFIDPNEKNVPIISLFILCFRLHLHFLCVVKTLQIFFFLSFLYLYLKVLLLVGAKRTGNRLLEWHKKKVQWSRKKIVLDKTSYKKKQSRMYSSFLCGFLVIVRFIVCWEKINVFFLEKSLKAISKIYMLRKLLRNGSGIFCLAVDKLLFKLVWGFFK